MSGQRLRCLRFGAKTPLRGGERSGPARSSGRRRAALSGARATDARRTAIRRSAVLALEALGLLPERLHLVETRAFGPPSVCGEPAFDMRKPPLEFGVRAAQRRLRIDADGSARG